MIEFDLNQPKAIYSLSEPREVPYKDRWPSLDDGCLDSCITSGRGEND